MPTQSYYVYIVTNYQKTVLYVGVTNNLSGRINEHYRGLVEGFSKKYNCKYLVFYQHFPNISFAISREKEIKKWRRAKKNELISKLNPEWKFLNEGIASIEKVYEN